MRNGRSPAFRFGVGATTFAALAVGWYIATTATHFLPQVYFPMPAEVGQAFRQIAIRGYADGKLYQHFLHSCWLVLMGFTAAVSIGIPLGMLMGWSRRAEALVNPAFLLLRPIPPLAWIPLAIVWLGLGDAAKVLVIWFAAFVPAVINSYAGVRAIEPHLIEAARSLGIGRTMLVREVLFPGALPLIFTGLRLSLQACWTTLVAAELIGAIVGLGHVLYQAGLDLFPAMIVVGMMGVAVAGGLMTLALGWLEARSMPWRAR
ncbi:MAG TPA: ABC transporter permease [Casimicrobiaceae bacterium]|jgi:NitT/TauT family transport system permease protein/taurine transport system permease protein